MKSKHVYPGTTVLKNFFQLKDQETLDKYESIFTLNRMADLEKNPIRGNFNLKHLKDIHYYIFQDVYPFAGHLRDENIAKDTFRFADVRFIEPAADVVFNQLKGENQLVGLNKEEFAKRAAYYMAEINVLHPFREGNGRAQREFIRTLGVRNGYSIDWSRVNKEEVVRATILSKDDERSLAKVIYDCTEGNEPNFALKKQYLDLDRGLER